MTLKTEDVKRIKLHSYIATCLEKLEVSDREKEAITKLMFLSKEQFDDLVEDVIEEIERRTLKTKPKENNYSVQRNHSKKRLSTLTSKRFKNLVLDVFLVYNHKYPTKNTQNLEELEDLISQLELFITTLKGEEQEDNIIIQIENTVDFNERYQLIVKHITEMCNNSKTSTKFIKYLDEMVNISPLNIIMSPTVLLKSTEYLDNTNKKILYNFHKKNILNNKNEQSIVKKEMVNIVELAINDMIKIDNKIDLKEEINMLISILIELKEKERTEDVQLKQNEGEVMNEYKNIIEDEDNIEKEDKIENMSLKERILLVLIKIYHKVKNEINTDELQQIIQEIDADENLEEKILEAAVLVKEILHKVAVL